MQTTTEEAAHIAFVSATLDLSFLKEAVRAADPKLRLSTHPQDDIATADIVVAWNPPHGLLATLSNVRMVHSIAAGLDNILADPNLPDVPICRVVDKQHALGMAEYAIWSVLLFHRNMDLFLRNARERLWQRPPQVSARNYTIGILGFGAIGRAVGHRLKDLDYRVRGWSRSPRAEEGIETFHGNDQLDAFLSGCDLLICLLPLTEATRGILNADLFAKLAPGSALVNMGRGEHLIEADLLAALESGQLRGAVLDVFHQEPLPASSPLWDHPRVFVTPHIASMPDPHDVAGQICENARRAMSGQDLLNVGDRESGY